MHGVQGTFDELGTALSTVTFVVVDLETTGGSPADVAPSPRSARSRCAAARCSASSRRWSTRPCRSRAFISVAHRHHRRRWSPTPRASSRVAAGVPRVRPRRRARRPQRAVRHRLPQGRGAPRTGHDWPGFAVLDTVHLARQLVTRDEAPNHKLSTLAALFGATTTPDHRALHDARATVDVLHAPPRAGRHPRGRTPSRSSRRSPPGSAPPSAASATSPTACRTRPGVYLFKDRQRPGALRRHVASTSAPRVRTYFTASEQRTPDGRDGAASPSRVTPDRLRHHPRGRGPRAAAHRRAQAALQPPLRATPSGRRGSSSPSRPFPRLSHRARGPRRRRPLRRPVLRRGAAEAAIAAVHEVLPLRQCTQRLSPAAAVGRCALADMGRCGAPVHRGRRASRTTPPWSPRPCALLGGDAREVVDGPARPDGHARRPGAVRGRRRRPRPACSPWSGLPPAPSGSAPLAACPELVAARRRADGGWEVVCVRHGRLAGSTISPAGRRPDALHRRPCAPAPRSSRPAPARCRRPRPRRPRRCCAGSRRPACGSSRLEGEWTCPVHGAGAARARLEPLAAAPRDAVGFDEPARRPVRRPLTAPGPARRAVPLA